VSDQAAGGGQLILLLCPTGRDGPVTQKVLSRAGLDSRICSDADDLCRHLNDSAAAGAAVIAEEALVRPEVLQQLLDVLARQPVWSDLPLVILTARATTGKLANSLSASLEPRANVTFLERPLRVLTLVSTLRAALRARNRQHQVRELLNHTQEQVGQRDRFLALLGHELRNTLAAIRTAAEVLDNIRSDDESIASEQRQVIVRQTKNLAHLVDDLLDVARITAGKITLNRRTLDVAQLVSQSVSSIRLAMRPLRQRVLVELPAGPLWVNGDPVRLEQVVTNLVGNAIKYTHDDGVITVKVCLEGGRASIDVCDNGIGIPRDTVQHIFEPFYRVDSPQAQLRGGLGLGLAVVRGLVELHGGQINADSDGPGCGSRFSVLLPTAAPPAPSATGDQTRPAAVQRRSVLVVEDADDARRAMATLLKLWGHRVDAAQDGPEGVQIALERKPEVALIDIGLPGFDGYEVARQLRSALGGGIHLIALTGYGQAEDRKRALEAGFDRHLVKPVDPAVLSEVLSANGNTDRAPARTTPRHAGAGAESDGPDLVTPR
jgi:signal transduction histidine kinase/ActR/RegA family two-component response regulator